MLPSKWVNLCGFGHFAWRKKKEDIPQKNSFAINYLQRTRNSRFYRLSFKITVNDFDVAKFTTGHTWFVIILLNLEKNNTHIIQNSRNRAKISEKEVGMIFGWLVNPITNRNWSKPCKHMALRAVQTSFVHRSQFILIIALSRSYKYSIQTFTIILAHIYEYWRLENNWKLCAWIESELSISNVLKILKSNSKRWKCALNIIAVWYRL